MTMYLGSDDQGTQESTLQDFAPTGMQKMNAAVREAWMESYGPVTVANIQARMASEDGPKLSTSEAEDIVKQSGVTLRGLSMADGVFTKKQLDVLIDRQRELTAVKDVRNRTPWELSSVARGAAMFGAGMVDPINLATAFVPWTRSISTLKSVAATAAVGETFAARTGARALLGAADAGISTAVLEPLYYAGRQSLGDDYTAYDSMANIAFGTAFGGGVHTLGGALGDLMRYRAQRAAPVIDPTPETMAAAVDMTPEQRLEAGIAPESARAGMPEIVEPVGRVDAPAAVVENVPEVPNVRRDLLQALRRAGGIDPTLARDAGGENGLRLNRKLPGVVKRDGLTEYDQIAEILAEEGFLPAGIESGSDEAIRMTQDMVTRAFNGERVLRIDDQIAEMEARQRADFAESEADRLEAQREAMLEREAIQAEAPAREVAAFVEPETREAALRASVAQMMDGREVDVDAIVGMDPNLATHTVDDVAARADANFAPENRPLSDVGASEAVDARNAAAPKWEEMSAAEQAEAEAMALLDDTIKAGDQAFKYARGSKRVTPEQAAENLAKWSNDAPLVTSEAANTHDFKTGEKVLLEAFHGTKRPDRVGTKFLKKRATSGPMAYHTSDPALASNYAQGKADTSLSNEEQDYSNWFKITVPGQRNPVDVARSWYSLPPEVKTKIEQRLPDIRTDDDGNVIYEEGGGDIGAYEWELKQTQRGYDRRGNPLKAAVETWLTSGALFNDEEKFMDVLRLAGMPMKDVQFDSPFLEFPAVYKNYIAIQKPLVTSDVPQEVVDALNAAAKKDRSRAAQSGADMWDKNTRTLRDWVAAFNAEGSDRSYVWTSIPDKVTEVFKSLGYDGIIDWSGKGGGSIVSPVYIPFEETQVKSAMGNRGTFDPTKNDILYSRGIEGQQASAVLDGALKASFGDASEALIARGQIQIVATPKDIPGGPHPADVKAATAPDGTVYVVAENISEAEARGIVLHEVGVHVGMREMLGADVFDSVLAELDDAILRGESWANDARAAVPADTPMNLVREEQLAYLVQNSPDLPLVQRIVAAVRAWAFRTFAAARERMTLTEADFRAMAVAALHDVAKRGEAAGSAPLELAYSRGETPDPSTAADELKPYDDAVARAKSYAGVLRAAADKLDNDAQAVAAMRAALPDITPAEIDNLLGELRKQVKSLRGVARTARTAMQSGDVANDLQFDAMQAADTLANNLQMASVIEKRNAALNINARMKAATFVNQFRKPGLDFEGFRALLVGTERKRVGGRMSVEAEQKQFRGEWLGGMIADLEKQGLTKVFTSGDFDRDISAALWNLGKDGAGNDRLPREAVQVAEIINKYQNDARNTRNRFGAWIRDLKGYIARQTHDMFKIREAGESDWVQFVSSRLDIAKMVRLGLISETDPMASLRGMYDDFAAGLHMKTPTDDSDLVAFRGTQNLAKKVSASRTLYFKDGNAAHEYNVRFGQGRLAELVLTGLDNAAKSAGLLKVLGTNPEATMQRLFDEYAESLRGDSVRRAQFVSKRKEMENLLAHVTGAANIPGDATAAKISANTRAWVSMSRLGGALISSVTDLANYAAEMRFGQKKNLLGGVLDGIGAVTRGRAKGEKQQVLSSLGVFHESTLGSVYARFDNPDLIGGKMSWAMQQFFKLNGLNWWTESLRDGYALAHSHYLAQNSSKKWDGLPNSLRDMLQLYNIDAGKWELLRLAPLNQADGRMYMTPDGLATIPQSAMEAYITSVGRKVSDAAILNLQDDLAGALRAMTIDRMHHAVIEPGARARAFLMRGTQPGTVVGEILRFVWQFKSFPVALVQTALGREVYGRGYDTLGEYMRNGRGEMLGLVSFMALSAAMGYAAMSIKDLLRGKNPRPLDNPNTWAAAFVQGGGLGLYGDFLFGKYNRMGQTLSGSMTGPVANVADTLADLWTRIRTGDDVAAASFKALLDNTPFMNLFYVRSALDYAILYRIQEALNPGFLRRMERRAQTEYGQTFYLPPSQVAQ